MLSMRQAKEFFCSYNGFKFHMAREEPGMMMEYDKSNISREMEEKWRQEILDKLENMYYTRYDTGEYDGWCMFSNFLEVLGDTKTECDKNGERLLKIIDYAVENLDQKQKILIMEEMPLVICWISKYTNLKENLMPLTNRLMDFRVSLISSEHGWTRPQERYGMAYKHIRKAFSQYLRSE